MLDKIDRVICYVTSAKFIRIAIMWLPWASVVAVSAWIHLEKWYMGWK